MYLKINEDLYNKIQKITMTNYEAEGEYIPVDSIEPMLEDLLYEISGLEEKIQDMERDIEDNFRPVSLKEQYGICEVEYL
jgi:hypothetical protein